MKLSMTLPRILIDTREQTPLVFPQGIHTRKATLQTGDYSIEGYSDVFTVERKSLADLVNTVIHDRARFERELKRMTTFSFRRLLIIAPWQRVMNGNYHFSMARGKAVMASISAFEVRYNIPLVFVNNTEEATKRLIWWAWYYVREQIKHQEGTPRQ